MNRSQIVWQVAAICLSVALQSGTFASTTVFLDFTGDWGANLDLADDFIRNNFDPNYPWGNFTQNEKNQIIERTFVEIRRVWEGYDIGFAFSDPGGNRDRVDFAAVGFHGGLGPFGQTQSNYLGNFGPNSDASLFLEHFWQILNALPANATQQQRINALAVEMGRITSHELGHIYGLNHWQMYGQPSITPANYASTGAVQRGSLMAKVGPVIGVGKNLNPLERAILDISGGSRFGGDSLVNQPVLETFENSDAGGTPATAAQLFFAEGESSGLRVAYHSGELHNSANDVDVYQFTTLTSGALTVNVLSGASSHAEISLRSFNPKLRLIGPDGVNVMAEFDDTYYSENTFNQTSYIEDGQTIPVARQTDLPFMVNWPLAVPGTYYLEVLPVADNDLGDQYQILSTYSGMITHLLTFMLPGDYNGDGVVDAADFTQWRDILGGPSGTLLNNINGGPIREAHYDTWNSHFGDTLFGDFLLTTAVPEPPTMVLQVLASVGLCLVRDRAKYRNRKTGAICKRSLDG